MDRKEFTQKLIALGACPIAMMNFGGLEKLAGQDDNQVNQQLKADKEFIQQWLTDLLDSIEKNLDRETQVKLVEACGKSCFSRHKFKTDIAEKGKGDIDKLIEAYKENFGVWREGNEVHVRYGKVSKKCYCPAANYRPAKPNELHCECTRMTHQSIFETALGRPIKVDIVETLRRGGVTCHFIAHV